MTNTTTSESKIHLSKKIINPWQWQDNMGYSQAIEISHANSTLYCAGQAAMDENGIPIAKDMAAQTSSALDNLETVLKLAGYTLSNVVRLNFYTTSIPDFFAAYGNCVSRLAAHNCKPASTLIEVKALAFPQLFIEIEATAVK